MPVAAGRPSREEYREALRTRPEYVVTREEPRPAEEPGPYRGFFELARLGD